MTIQAPELKQALKACRGAFIAVGSFSFVINLLMLTISIYMLQVFDRVLTSQSIETLVYLTLIAILAIGFMGFLEVMRSRVLVGVGVWFDEAMAPPAFERTLERSMDNPSYGVEALRDLSTVRGFLSGGGILAIFDAPWFPIYVLFVYLLHPALGHLALFGAFVLLGLGLTTDRLTRPTLGKANAVNSENLRRADSAFRNIEAVNGMGMGGSLAGRWRRDNALVITLQTLASDRAGLVVGATKTFRMFLQIAVLGLGAYLVVRKQLSPGGMIAASIIMGRALSPVEMMIGTWKNAVGAWEAWRRIDSLFAVPRRHADTMELPRPAGVLSVENVTYTPPGALAPVLHNVTLDVQPGEALAIIGPSAAGKSTLARLMIGLASPQSGCVRLDDADISQWNRDRLGQYIGYLPQTAELFPGTIGENIARLSDASAADIIAAAQLAGVHEMILRLPDGYDTRVAPGVGILSGGQRQRIGLARALFNRPALLVLDEPNASLDAVGETALNNAIKAAKALGSTIVLVAHRPTLMEHVDKVAVLNEGRLHMYGPREAVISKLMRPAAKQVQAAS